MKLLIITQKVDIDDSILGFFHEWICRFAEYFEKIIVICLQKGKYNLPKNVKVLSLGKEKKKSRLKYIFNFYKYILRERRNYNIIFVHMNPIYVLLGGLLWKFWKKKIYLWYNHRSGNWIAKTAIKITDSVFYTSPFSFSSKFQKSQIMPAGIDSEAFKREENVQKIPNSILCLGRISPIKNIDVLIEAVKILDKRGINFVLNIAGDAITDKDSDYFRKIKEASQTLGRKGKIRFLGRVPHYKTVEIYNQNEVFVNLTNPGSLDKTILEAMVCETLVLVSNKSFCGVLPPELIFEERNKNDLAEKLDKILSLQSDAKKLIAQKLRDIVVKNHSLDKLVFKIINLIK